MDVLCCADGNFSGLPLQVSCPCPVRVDVTTIFLKAESRQVSMQRGRVFEHSLYNLYKGMSVLLQKSVLHVFNFCIRASGI